MRCLNRHQLEEDLTLTPALVNADAQIQDNDVSMVWMCES